MIYSFLFDILSLNLYFLAHFLIESCKVFLFFVNIFATNYMYLIYFSLYAEITCF